MGMLSICETILSHTDYTRKQFHRTRSIRGTNITLQICLESRIGSKEQRRKIGNRGRETRNKEVRYGTEDGIQRTETWDREQRAGNKEQKSETGNRERETRNREVRHRTDDGRQGTKK